MRKSVSHGSYAFFLGSLLLGCSAGSSAVGGTGEDSTSGESTSTTSSAQGGAGAGSTGTFVDPSTGGNVVSNCMAGADEDFDMDGFTITNGDCNDCDANVNPGAIEVGMEDAMGGMGGYQAADEDCDGTADNPAPPCDTALAIQGTDPMDGARAIELCKVAGNGSWGVESAQWVRANGTPSAATLHSGTLDGFGTNVLPRAGGRLLAISSGQARDMNDAGYVTNSSYTFNGPGTPPPGFPQNVPGCSGGSNINDDVGLDLQIKAPTNATGYSFDFRFYSFEYPEWVCTTYNDQFIALVNPAPTGAINGNISFDSMNNPVSVNIAFFDVCSGCALGTGDLQGTGFGDFEGATGWLQTSAPIQGGTTFNLRYAIWDTGDSALDSTSLIDNFKWVANGGTVSVGTIDVPQ